VREMELRKETYDIKRKKEEELETSSG